MATCDFFLFKIWLFRFFFGTKKKCLSIIRTGFFFARQNTKISREKKNKKTLQVLAFSLIFSFPLFCASHISFVREFHAYKGNIPLKILYFLMKKIIRIAKFRGKKGEIFEFFGGHISSVHSSFGLVAYIYIYLFIYFKPVYSCISKYY
jgi:hypothetical protein